MIRVTQRMLYGTFIGNMNNTLSRLMDLNIQASSQKKINKPSDDPAGSYRVLDHREALASITQYQRNIDTAQGWLKMADDTLLQVNKIVTRLKELAEQGSTGTLTADNREQISYEVRELYSQLVNLSNQRFEGKTIFSGHKVEDSAFIKAQTMRANDNSLMLPPAVPGNPETPVNFNVTGGSDETVLVQFTSPWFGVGTTYDYTKDGGRTWSSGVVAQDAVTLDYALDLGGTRIDIDDTTPPDFARITPVADHNDVNGTWWTVYPTARYMGDDNDVVTVDAFGASAVSGVAQGRFGGNVLVRVDGYDGVAQELEYSTSTDGGQTWSTANTSPAAPGATQAMLSVPGGTLNLTTATNVATDLAAGQQFSIRPRTANIAMEISPGESVVVNSVGKDVLGGIYRDPAASYDSVAFASSVDKNLFDAVGRLVSSLETNTQQGCANALEDLRSASEHLLNHTASVAGRENRLSVAESVLTNMELNETERLSAVEDVDISELMTKLAQQEVAYQAVLSSSSKVMNLSLVNYM